MPCLDTTALIDLTRERPTEYTHRLRDVLRRIIQNGTHLTTTRLNIAEMYVGMERSAHPKREQHRIDRILAELPVLEFDEAAAPVFGRMIAELHRSGRPVGDVDTLIAAIAVVNNEPIVTRNVKHFDGIAELTVIGY